MLTSMMPRSRRRTRLSVCLPALAVVALLTHAAAAADRPNVLLIISDDQAWTDYGFMGHPHIETPVLDQLARESVCFPRGYVPDSLCRPSLMTIVTGRYPHEHGVVGNDPPVPASLQSLSKGQLRGNAEYRQVREDYLQHIDRADTLADRLGEAGYLSHQSGKWWEGHFSRGGFTHGMTHGDRSRGGRHGDLGLKIGREGVEPIREFVAMAGQKDQPFFLYYAPFLPHSPHNPPQRLLEKYKNASGSAPIRRYYAMCEWFDETCGQVLDVLREADELENTIILYVCDNGWITDRETGRYAPRSKRSQYEGGIRTPIFVKVPGRAPRMDTEHAVSSIDLVPTTLAALGLEVPNDLPGINLLDAEAVASREAIFGEILEHDIQSMDDPVASLQYRWVIADGWKLIVPHEPRLPDQPVELFPLSLDPDERTNVAEAYPERVTQLRQRLDTWWTPTPAAATVSQR